jgi:hypothetical protein
MTDRPNEATTEIARLRVLLATARLERDDLARRLAAVLDEPPATVAGQQALPLPDWPGQRSRAEVREEGPRTPPRGPGNLTAGRSGRLPPDRCTEEEDR